MQETENYRKIFAKYNRAHSLKYILKNVAIMKIQTTSTKDCESVCSAPNLNVAPNYYGKTFFTIFETYHSKSFNQNKFTSSHIRTDSHTSILQTKRKTVSSAANTEQHHSSFSLKPLVRGIHFPKLWEGALNNIH